MTQEIKIPIIMRCTLCGSTATLLDWDFRDIWAVYCDKHPEHSMKTENITRNRAVHKWNNKQMKLLKGE